MRQLLPLLGLPDLPLPEFLTFLGFAATSAIMLGWIADGILKERGFGILRNAIILLVGGIAGVVLWRKVGMDLGASRSAATAIAATGCGILGLVAGGVMKRFI